MSKKPPPETLPSIDSTALATVSGGAARAASSSSDGDTATLQALGGILDSIKGLANNRQQSGFGPTELMMFMMLMNGNRGPQVVVAPPNGGYAGYTIDGQFYPFK